MIETLTETRGHRRPPARRAGDETLRGEGKRSGARDAEEREQREHRRRQEEALDEALMDTFPASDPIALVQPAPAS